MSAGVTNLYRSGSAAASRRSGGEKPDRLKK